MKKFVICSIAIIILISCFHSCGDRSSSSGGSSKGGSYGNGSQYDRDVGEIDDAYGEDSDTVDDVIGGMADAMN